MKALCVVLMAFLAVGCTTPVTTVATPVKVGVSLPCNATMPEEPAYPTQSFTVAPSAPDFLDRFVAAALAEIELRKGYIRRVKSELQSCINPNH